MKNIKKLPIFLIFLIFNSFLKPDARIILYLNHAPKNILKEVQTEWDKEINLDKNSQKIENLSSKTPFQISRKLLKHELKKELKPNLSNIPAFYGGYFTISNEDGLISFPLKHETPKTYLVITSKIDFNFLKGNTVLSEKLIKDKPAQIYSFEKKEDKNKQFYWKIKEEKIPSDLIINPISIILLTNPKNIFIDTKDNLSDNNKHLILPNNIYLISNLNQYEILLDFLDNNYLYEQIIKEEKTINGRNKEYLIK